jgi:hypothetical protein
MKMAKGSGTRLTGEDGKAVKVTLGTELVGDGAQDLETLSGLTGITKYQITAIATSASVFAAGYAVGDIFWDDGSTLVMATGDKCKPLVESDCHIQSWSMSFSKSEIDVTTLCDGNKVYSPGKSDITGSLNGVFTIGTTDADDDLANAFVPVITDSIGSSVTINEINNDNIYVELVKQDRETTGDIYIMYYMPIVVTTFEDGVEEGNPQAFSSSFRPADDVKMYRRTIS